MSKCWGIDVSKYQGGKVDYVKLKAAGATFVFIRIGCNKTKDTYFERDYSAAVAAGLKVGVYFATYSTDNNGAVADATRVLGWLADRHLDYPVAYDVEVDKQRSTSRRTANSKMYNAFAQKIEAGGVYDAMLYTGEYFYNNYFDKALLTDDLWIARYSNSAPFVGRQISIWQFTSDYVDAPYYKGKLDRNYQLVEKFQDSRTPAEIVSNNPYPVPTRLLKRTYPFMQTGNDVKWLQWELWQAGYLKIYDIDGKFGNGTLAAVKAYQTAHGLLVDGKVGSATRYEMQHDVAA